MHETLYTVHVLLLGIAAIGSSALGRLAWRRRLTPGARPYGWIMLVITLMSLLNGVSVLISSRTVITLCSKGILTLISITPVLLLHFVREYTGHAARTTARWWALMLLVPAMTLVLNVTNAAHGWFAEPETFERTGAYLIPRTYSIGPWFVVHTTYSYLVTLIGLITLAQAMRRMPAPYQAQSRLILIGLLMPIFATVVSTLQIRNGMVYVVLPFAFVFMGVVHGWALFRYRLFDLMPIARDRVLEHLHDAVFVIDDQQRIIDLNPAAQTLVQRPRDASIGTPVADVLPGNGDLLRLGTEAAPTGREVHLEDNGETRWFDLSVNPLAWQDHHTLGHIIVMRDISARKRAEAEREQLIQDLDSYAHTVAHDLKNPLATIYSCSLLLADDFERMPLAQTQECLHIMEYTALKMSNIVEELLLLASVRIQDSVPCAPLDMATILHEAQARLVQLIEEYEPVIDLHTVESWPKAIGYAPWIEEVWVNYLSNAIKYGGTPPHIELGADDPAQGMVRFWVRDNGPGIPVDAQAGIFGEFTRLKHARAQGHGLGLSIVQRIVEKCGGTVGVDSAPGQGSTFFFTLAAADLPPRA